MKVMVDLPLRLQVPRDDQQFTETVRRVRAEFMEMPGLVLTLPQAARLWSLEAGTCAAVLGALIESGFLVRRRDAAFMRAWSQLA